MGFLSDVRALRAELQKQVSAGGGSASLTLALQAQRTPKASPAPQPTRPTVPPKVSAHRDVIAPAQRMSIQEYRQMMGLP